MRFIKVVIASLLLCLSGLSLAQVKPSIDRSIHFEVSAKSLHFDANGSTKTLTVTASDPWEVQSGNVSWCTIRKEEKTLKVTAQENSETTVRSGYFVLSCKSETIRVDVSQSASELYLTLSAQEINFGASGGTKTINISTNGSWDIGTKTSSWGHLTKSDNSLSVRIDANTNTSSRTDWFTVKTGNIEKRVSIKQKGQGTTLSLSSQDLNFESSGGTKTITVTTNGSWSIGTTMSSWGHLTKNGNTLEVKLDPNPGTSSRTDWFEIKAGNDTKRVNVTQKSNEASLEVHGYTTNMTKKFKESGGREYFSVKTSANSYETLGVPSWCYIEGKTSSGFTLVCSSNNNYSSRSDYMIVKAAGKEIRIDISQSGRTSSSTTTNNISSTNGSKTNKYSRWPYYYCNPVFGLRFAYIQRACMVTGNGLDKTEVVTCFGEDGWMKGFQLGLFFDPSGIRDWGMFGLNIGLNYEVSYSTWKEAPHDEYYEYYDKFKDINLYMPIDLTFHIPFSRRSALYLYGGIGMDFSCRNEFTISIDPDVAPIKYLYGEEGFSRFCFSYEYGLSLKLGSVMFYGTYQKGITNHQWFTDYSTTIDKISLGFSLVVD